MIVLDGHAGTAPIFRVEGKPNSKQFCSAYVLISRLRGIMIVAHPTARRHIT
jgi:hypothetical protein